MSNVFAINDLGKLHYFLGDEVYYHTCGLTLIQSKYIRELLPRANMDGAKPIATPMVTKLQLSQHGSSPISDLSFYRSLIGALQYITITHSDVSYTINKLCQFMHKPMASHFTVMKCLLRYLKATVGLKLQLSSASSSLPLHVFSNAVWASRPDDRRSTNGYCIFLDPT